MTWISYANGEIEKIPNVDSDRAKFIKKVSRLYDFSHFAAIGKYACVENNVTKMLMRKNSAI